MPIPDFQSTMLPILRLTADGRDHTVAESVAVVASEFGLTDEEVNERLPSGRQRVLHNRLAWAKAYLQKAGLVQPNGRGKFRITARGRQVLKENPTSLDVKDLERFSQAAPGPRAAPAPMAPLPGESPEELIAREHREHRRQLAADLLEALERCSPGRFHALLVELLAAMGYGRSREALCRSLRQTDESISGVIELDPLGFDALHVQARLGRRPIGRPLVQAFAGGLARLRARKGALIGTAGFSKDAHEYVQRAEARIVLIDGPELARLMIEHGVGVRTVATYTVHELDLEQLGGGD